MVWLRAQRGSSSRATVAAAAGGCLLALVGCGPSSHPGGSPVSRPSAASAPAPRPHIGTGDSAEEPQPRSPVASRGRPRATGSTPAADVTKVVDLGRGRSTTLALSSMRRGRAPRVPWIERATVHLPGHDVTVRDVAWDPGLAHVAPYGSGIVTDSYDDKAFEWMGWYAAAGRRVRTSYRDVRMAWSWARGEVTWYDLHRRRAVEASTETGQVLHRFGAPPHLAFPEPVGWLGADDVLFALNATASHPRSWRTSSSRVQPDPATVLAATAAGRLVAGVGGGGQGSDPSCVLAWRADRPELRRCGGTA